MISGEKTKESKKLKVKKGGVKSKMSDNGRLGGIVKRLLERVVR